MTSNPSPPASSAPDDSDSPGVGRFLHHLSAEQVNELMSRYYAGEPVASLLGEYSIACQMGQLVRSFPLTVLDATCPYCGVRLARRHRSRNSRASVPAFCRACGHTDEPRCWCKKCEAIAVERARATRERMAADIELHCRTANSRVTDRRRPDDLSPVAAIALLSLIHSSYIGEIRRLSPVSDAKLPFTPTDELSEELLFTLHDRGLILLDPCSRFTAFVFKDDRVVMPKLLEVGWRIASAEIFDQIHEVERRALDGELSTDWMESAMQLHMQLAAAECKVYVHHCLRERGLPIVATSSVDDLIENLLMDLSVSEAFCAIWIGAQQGADFKLRRRANPMHASNYAIDASRRWIGKIRSEGRTVKRFRRPSNHPRCALAYVLHDIILKVGKRGFEYHSSTLW